MVPLPDVLVPVPLSDVPELPELPESLEPEVPVPLSSLVPVPDVPELPESLEPELLPEPDEPESPAEVPDVPELPVPESEDVPLDVPESLDPVEVELPVPVLEPDPVDVLFPLLPELESVLLEEPVLVELDLFCVLTVPPPQAVNASRQLAVNEIKKRRPTLGRLTGNLDSIGLASRLDSHWGTTA
jgi:hypothetical protein